MHVHEHSLLALLLLALPSLAHAADITGVPKIREGDQVQIGTTRIRLGGIDAPSTDQLCLNTKGERWTCGVAARDELIKHAGGKSWTCHTRTTDRRGRTVARCEVDGEDIQKWLVSSGWALAYTRVSHDYEADEKAAREAKAGMWQGAFIAPWDWRVRNKKTADPRRHQAAAKAHAILLASASGTVAPSPDCTIKGNVNSRRRMHLSQADQPLVRADQDEDQQGHALVLLGRRGRSRRLPRDAAVDVAYASLLRRRRRRACRNSLNRAASIRGNYRVTDHPVDPSSHAARHHARLRARAADRCSRSSLAYTALAYLVLPALWTHYEHQKGLANLPMVTRTAQGIPGDAINVGLIGNEKEVLCAMNAAGWFPADPVTLKSSIEIAGSVLLDRAYQRRARQPPVLSRPPRGSRLREAGRQERRPPPSRALLESARQGRGAAAGLARRRHLRQGRRRQPFHRRHHPSYRCRYRCRARRCWCATSRTPGMATAKYQVTGVGPTLAGRNGGGDLYYTDGEVWILRLVADCRKQSEPGRDPAEPARHRAERSDLACDRANRCRNRPARA